jgi:hypothetical protein
METLELENEGLSLMSESEMKELNGGLIVGLGGVAVEVFKFLVGEAADFVEGVGQGYTWATTF